MWSRSSPRQPRNKADEANKEANKARNTIAKERLKEDMKLGGSITHKMVKGAAGARKEYVQPTHIVNIDGKINSEPMQVQKAFAEEWSEKVFRLQRLKPQWQAFQAMYSEYIPRVPYTQGNIVGEDLHRTVQAMG